MKSFRLFAGTVRLDMPDIRTRGKHGPNAKPDKEERIGQSCKEHAGKDSEQPEFASQKEFEAASPVHLLPRDVPDGKDKEKKTNRIGEKAMQAEGNSFSAISKVSRKVEQFIRPFSF